MDNCWFVLKQSHYPPPRLPKRGIGIANGAVSLGHIIPSLSELDGVINRSEEGIYFDLTVQIYHTESWGLDWKRDKGLEAGMATDVTAPMGPGVPVSAEQQTKTAFAHTEKNHQEFDTLDRYIIQVNRNFIRKLLADGEVVEHIERTKGIRLLGGRWSVFMITGITVARGAKGEFGESKKFEAMLSTKANVADAVSAGATANFANSDTTSSSARKTSDFVWAVRLTKIWKGAMDNDWNFRTVSKGATFSMNDEKPWREEIKRALSEEFLDDRTFRTLDLSDEEGMIIY